MQPCIKLRVSSWRERRGACLRACVSAGVRNCAPALARTQLESRDAASTSPIDRSILLAGRTGWCGVHAPTCRKSFFAERQSICDTWAHAEQFRDESVSLPLKLNLRESKLPFLKHFEIVVVDFPQSW